MFMCYSINSSLPAGRLDKAPRLLDHPLQQGAIMNEHTARAPLPPAGSETPLVRLGGISKRYGTVEAVKPLDLEIRRGDFLAILGPSGCGKTTLLRIIGGFVAPTTGTVEIDGQDMTAWGPEKRPTNTVFQGYGLFPHMTVRQNVAFGLRLRKVSAAQRDKRAIEMLDLVGLSTQADRYPHQISGGQQQRVALARALAIEPQVLLLDEPLSALDAKVRAQLRDEIRRIQLDVGITTLFVTHDQEEALAIADRVGVMREGRLEQLAPPTEVYSRPATSFVAEFVGLSNRLAGEVRGGEVIVRGCKLPLVERDTPDGQVVALVRPEAVSLASNAPEPGTEAGSGPLTGTVIAITFLGATSRVTVDLGDTRVMAQLPTSEASALAAGSRVVLAIRPDPVLVSAGADPAAAAAGEEA
jgi:putative spermidine/putrescine transport system ATP-binding protein